MAFSSADVSLAARMEAAEAANVAAMGAALKTSDPACEVLSVGGGVAVFAGTESPITHAVGIGMRGAVTSDKMALLEDFYSDRGAPCVIDLCPLAHPSVIAFVQSRPYEVIEFNNVLARNIDPSESFSVSENVRSVHECEVPHWARLVSEGFAESMPLSDEMVKLLAVTCRESQCWIAGASEALAGAAMGIQERVALFYGDATLVRARRQGLHSALISRRLMAAQEGGCTLAMTSVLPGSASHRNYERAGFQLIYMRVNLRRMAK